MSNVCDAITGFPPPPPPLPDLSVIPSVNPSSTDITEESESEVLTYVSNIYKHLVCKYKEPPSVFKYTHLKSFIQDGPTCGLVALSMVSSSSSNTLKAVDLLDLARRRGFTKKGEMFSAPNMASLAQEVLSKEFEVLLCQGGIEDKRYELITNLLSGDLYLIPYDADKNHSPAILRGRKAHWGILCGVLGDVSTTCYLLGKQSKSRHVALWDFDTLHDSNMNLAEIAIDKANSAEYVVDNIKSTLAGYYILFRKR